MGIPGLVTIGLEPMRAPRIGVLAREKSGKSTLAISLENWPRPGCRPLVLAFDETGPVSCAKLGHPQIGIVVKDCPGVTLQQKMAWLISNLRQNIASEPSITSIVVDCTSTMAEFIFDEMSRSSRNPDERDTYKRMNNLCKAFFWQLCDLGLPTIWIAWLREPATHKENGVSRFIPGGPQIPGEQFRNMFAGACQALVLLEKRLPAPNDPPQAISSDGWVRQFRTKSYAGINCEARFGLPDPMPAHLGWLLQYIVAPLPPSSQQPAQAPQVQTPQ